MADASIDPPTQSQAPRRDEPLALNILERGYSLALLLIIMFLSYRSVRYLVVSLITPGATPAQISQLPKRLDSEALVGRRPDWLGIASVENPRGPLAHFHRFENWIQIDGVNDCTRSGCHGPLPHGKQKADRAFLNMHSTTLHCGVCHLNTDASPLPLVWYDVKDGTRRGPPALLQAVARADKLRDKEAKDLTAQDQSEIVALLHEADRDAGGEPGIKRLADHLAAVRAGSAPLAQLIQLAGDILPRYFRGAYGAKLALLDAPSGKPVLTHPGAEDAIREFLKRGGSAGQSERESMLKNVHPLRRETPLQCQDCHVENGSRVDVAALGYPAVRVRALSEPAIFKMIENIREGRPFYLPAVSMPQTAPAPTSAPASK
ncbi:MAG: hypothetical protein HZB38_15170 [Planctomycetes bacterium]|nr:hypothetical protein [Planctomycetota bacterium]